MPSDPLTTPDDQESIWMHLVARSLHPLKVTIVEALLWVDAPLSATDLALILDRQVTAGLVSYHLKELKRLGVAKVVRTRQVRGAKEKFYGLELLAP